MHLFRCGESGVTSLFVRVRPTKSGGGSDDNYCVPESGAAGPNRGLTPSVRTDVNRYMTKIPPRRSHANRGVLTIRSRLCRFHSCQSGSTLRGCPSCGAAERGGHDPQHSIRPVINKAVHRSIGGMPPLPPINFWGPAAKEFARLPPRVIEIANLALEFASAGDKLAKAKPLRLPGIPGTKVMEIVIDSMGDTYRIVYTTAVKGEVWVLRAFQKKSTIGIKTSPAEIRLILSRFVALMKGVF